MYHELSLIGIILIICFILYLFKLIEEGPYIQNISKKYRIKILRNLFEPNYIEINKGDTISWRNYDIIRHSISTIDPNIHNSPVLLPNSEFEYTFYKPGNFIFNSSLYNNYKPLRIKVKESLKNYEFLNNFKNNIIILINNILLNIRNNIKNILLNIINYIKNILLNIINYIKSVFFYSY